MLNYYSGEFRVADTSELSADEPLVIHSRRGEDNTNLVVFVHGLGGSRYGTWGNFPKFVFDDFKESGVAIGLYAYRTAFGRLRFTASIDLEREAKVLADVIRDLPPSYRRIVLIAHSMGGLLAKAAVKSLIDRDERTALARTAGLILMATPQAGSMRVPSFLALFSYDARALKPHGEFVTRITETFTNRISQTPVPDKSGRFVIRVWAVVAPADQWVDRLSAGLNLESSHIKDVRGSHTSIVKPKHKNADAYTFVKRAIAECLTPAPEPVVATVVAPAPVVHSGLTVHGGSNTFSSSPATQVTQVLINLLPQAELGPQIVSQLTQGGFSVLLPAAGPSHFALMREAQPKPRIDELFEVITDPDEVMTALFQTAQSSGLAPYDVDYISSRQGLPDVQQALETALRETKGRLLVSGPRGIGKTREVAELARAACSTKWNVLVARNEGNPRLGPLLELPPELIDAKVLIVIDNLHTRIAGTDQPTTPYMARLELLVEWLERRLPGSLRVLATARDEPRFQPYLDLPRNGERWRSFGVFRLPDITEDGLRKMLTALAVRASVPVAAEDVPKLIENSDRKPETVFINVDRARHMRTALTQSGWLPTEGESWLLRFVSARAEHSGVDRVCQALHLLTKAGLPARVPYVASLARASGERDPEAAVEALVGDGLLGLRQGVVTPFSAEQLQELLGLHGASGVKLEERSDALEQAITDADKRPPEWADDLLALCLGLDRAGSTDRAERVASRAIELGAGGARAYRIRAGIRFGRRDLPAVEADLTKALEIGGDEADTLFLRASIRNLLGNFAGALEDLDVAMQRGRDDRAVHTARGNAYYQLARWRDADSALSTAIERGDASGVIFFTRGTARLQLKDATGAEQDFSAALELGVDLDDVPDQLREIETGVPSKPASAPVAGPASGNLMAYALRGFVRFILEKNAAAEEDLTAAIEGGVGERFSRFADAIKESSLPLLVRVHEKLKELPAPFGEGPLFHLRGLARLRLDRPVEAEADFDEALARGFGEGEVYLGRGWARLRMEKPAEAEQDATVALERGKEDAPTYSLRGLARLALQKFSEAEQDFAKALELDAGNSQLLAWRGVTRIQQHRLPDAEADLTAAVDRGADARTLFTRGCVRFDLQKYVEAEQDLTAALGLGFDHPSLLTLRGSARLTQNKLREADEDATAAFARGAKDIQAYSLRAAARLAQERFAEAEPDLSAAIELGRNDEWIFFNRGRARQELERFADAEKDYDAVVALGAIDPNVFGNRGLTRLRQGRATAAVEDFTAAIKAGRDDALVHLQLSRAHRDQKKYPEAEAEVDLALARDSQPAVRGARGYIRLLRGNVRGAEDEFSEVIAREPMDAMALHARGLARYAQGKVADALTDFDEAVKSSPNVASFLGSRVLVSLRLGDFEKAEKDCGQLEAIDRDASETQGSLGVLRLALGDFDEALGRFGAAVERERGWDSWRGLAYLMTGRLHEAAQAYRQGTADSAPGDIVLTLNELDFYVGKHPDRVASPEAQATLALIRAELRQKLDEA
jgi:tetratricopeptide (TPR) repeat protein/pimeloyl-ACP methyl ester carboxylesterase